MLSDFVDIGLRRSDINVIDVNLAAGGFFQRIDAAKHRGLAGARLAHDGDKFALLNPEGDAVQGPDLALFALVVNFIKILITMT